MPDSLKCARHSGSSSALLGADPAGEQQRHVMARLREHVRERVVGRPDAAVAGRARDLARRDQHARRPPCGGRRRRRVEREAERPVVERRGELVAVPARYHERAFTARTLRRAAAVEQPGMGDVAVALGGAGAGRRDRIEDRSGRRQLRDDHDAGVVERLPRRAVGQHDDTVAGGGDRRLVRRGGRDDLDGAVERERRPSDDGDRARTDMRGDTLDRETQTQWRSHVLPRRRHC